MRTMYVVSNIEDFWFSDKVWVLRRNTSVGWNLGAVKTPEAIEPQEAGRETFSLVTFVLVHPIHHPLRKMQLIPTFVRSTSRKVRTNNLVIIHVTGLGNESRGIRRGTAPCAPSTTFGHGCILRLRRLGRYTSCIARGISRGIARLSLNKISVLEARIAKRCDSCAER